MIPESGRAELFRQVALPFGSRTAVNAFIRCARFLQWVAAKCLRVPVSCYFDDLVSFTYPNLASNTQATMCLMLDILGWKFDKEGPKSDDFSMLVKALGVQFDLSNCADGFLEVCNTEKRIKETVELVDSIISEGKLEKKLALIHLILREDLLSVMVLFLAVLVEWPCKISHVMHMPPRSTMNFRPACLTP